jgi:NAD(P)H-hydrate epimerase
MKPLYRNNKTKQIDQLAATALGIDSFQLMQRAGEAIFQHLKYFQRLLVVTGPGNNGGDGFVVAELARQNQQDVLVYALCDVAQLKGDALKAAKLYQGEWVNDLPEFNFDCVLDAIFGTGLTRAVTGRYADTINWINSHKQSHHTIQVVSVDVPSGLNGSTGQATGAVVHADQTIAVLAAKTGLFTLAGKEYCGELKVEKLAAPTSVFESIHADALLLKRKSLKAISLKRSHNSHKGSFGHVLTIGGQAGMMGAVLLAGKAVLKSGAGLTTVITDAVHADWLPLQAPELMTMAFDGMQDSLSQQLVDKAADVVLIGMGMGQSQWSKQLYKSALQLALPIVMDADALHLLASAVVVPKSLKVITPHPKEAAALLSVDVEEVQMDRWQTVKKLANKFQCVAVLKGSGTLISDGYQIYCCPFGNANLATAGSGDVLSGMIAGLMAQGFPALQASCLAVLWHAIAGEESQFGLTMTATDLLNSLYQVVR